jgi:hypothetical protein
MGHDGRKRNIAATSAGRRVGCGGLTVVAGLVPGGECEQAVEEFHHGDLE